MLHTHSRSGRRLVLFAVMAAITASTLWWLRQDEGAPWVPPATRTTAMDSGPAAAAVPGPATAQVPAAVPTSDSRRDRADATATITGRTIRRDGSVVPGVTVRAADGTRARSGNDGGFELSGLTGGVHTLHAEVADAITVPTGAIRVRGGDTVTGVDLILEPACFLTGRVTANGQPLANAQVAGRLHQADALADLPPGALADGTRLATNTEADGAFRLGPFVPGRVELTVEHASSAPFARLYPSNATGVQVAVALVPTIHGVVLEPDGQSSAVIERVLLQVQSPQRSGWFVAAETKPTPADAAAGRFQVAVPMSAPVRVVVVTRDFALARSETLRVRPDQTEAPLELRAERGTRVVGHVRDERGNAVAEAEVVVREEGMPQEMAHTRSATDGAFVVALAAGRHAVSIGKPGYSPRIVPFEVAADQPVSALDCVLVQGGSLRGRILAPEGVALPVLEVHATRVDDAKAVAAVAMIRDGAFSFDYLAAGEYRVGLRDRSDRTSAAETATVRVGNGQQCQLDLQPHTLGLCRLRGNVTRNGAAVPFVTLQLTRTAARRLASTTADRNGCFEFAGLAAGELTLTVSHGANGPVLAKCKVDLRPGEDRQETIRVAHGSLAGQVVAADSKQPIGDLKVEVKDNEGHVVATSRTDPNGRFHLPMVQSGEGTLAIARIGGAVVRQVGVRIAANRVTEVPRVEL